MTARALLLGVALAASASPAIAAPPTEPTSSTGPPHSQDPWEGLNRGLYGIGQVLDRVALRPVAMCYRHWLPRPLRHGVSNVLSNLDEPDIGVNDLLQGKPRRAGATALRFVINSTVGVVGVFDVASHAGLPHHDNDAGITLGVYNVSAGPYMYLPLAGPSSVRDAVGAGIDFIMDPVGWANFKGANTAYASQFALEAIDQRVIADSDLRQLNHTAVDPYATLRSYYLQSREAMVRGRPLQIEDLPDLPDWDVPLAPPAQDQETATIAQSPTTASSGAIPP